MPCSCWTVGDEVVRAGVGRRTRSWLLSLDPLQSVIGGVLVGLAVGGDVEGPVDEGVDGLAGADGGLAVVDQLRGELADNGNPEQATIRSADDQLDQPLRRPSELAPGTLG